MTLMTLKKHIKASGYYYYWTTIYSTLTQRGVVTLWLTKKGVVFLHFLYDQDFTHFYPINLSNGRNNFTIFAVAKEIDFAFDFCAMALAVLPLGFQKLLFYCGKKGFRFIDKLLPSFSKTWERQRIWCVFWQNAPSKMWWYFSWFSSQPFPQIFWQRKYSRASSNTDIEKRETNMKL